MHQVETVQATNSRGKELELLRRTMQPVATGNKRINAKNTCTVLT